MSSKDEVNALSARCPHLGCTINFDAVSKKFRCPCHGSTFTDLGKRVSGPARKNLQKLPLIKKPDGNIEIVINT